MANFICPHWIPVHYSGDDDETLRRWNPAFLKVVTSDLKVPYLASIPEHSTIVVRSHPVSENYGGRGFPDLASAKAMARRHIYDYRQIVEWCETQNVPRSRIVCELLNEPHVWSDEPADWLAQYTIDALDYAHTLGMRLVTGLFGVGWPGNGGVTDAPVDWSFWRDVPAHMGPGDYLGLHEYWALNGPGENWRWWAGRFQQCPYNVPILVTECGIDTGVTGNWGGGWLDLPGSTEEKAARYIGELRWYADKCLADGRIKGIFPFTYDIGSREWERFDLKHEEFRRQFLGAQLPQAPGPELPSPPEPPADTLDEALADVFLEDYADVRALLPSNGLYASRLPGTIKRIVIHHAAVTTTWETVARCHAEQFGWPGIGYHLGINTDGSVAYLGDVSTVRYHAGSANADSIGICVMGNYETGVPTAAAMGALRRVVAVLDKHFGVLPIVGHRDVEATACPGRNLYALLSTLRLVQPEPAEPLPEDELATDPATLAQKVRWWLEEYTRCVEQAKPERAKAILYSLVKREGGLLYRLEDSLSPY